MNLITSTMDFSKGGRRLNMCGIMHFTVFPFPVVQHWECRLFFSVFQYAIACSYVWIFLEAAYLHMLIFVAVFNERAKVRWFMLFGWGKAI